MAVRRLAALAWLGAVTAVLAACWAPMLARAQAASEERLGQARTLGSLVDRAWQRASRARAAEGRQLEATARRLEAESPFAGAPAVTLSSRDDRFAGSSTGAREHIATLSAPVWLPGQQGARGALADAEVAHTEAAAAALRLTLAGEVRERVWELAAAEAELQLATGRAESSAALQADVARRMQAGDLARADALLAQQDTLAAQSLARQAELRRHEAALRLELLAGTLLQGLPDEQVHEPVASDAHPELIAARLARESAERRARFVSLSRRDPPEVGVGYRWDRPTAEVPAGRTVGVSIRIPLATAARNLPRQVAAQTEIDAALADERITRERIDLGVRAARAAVDAQQTGVALSAQRMAAAREREALVRRAFDFGEERLAELLRARAATREAESAAARDHAALGLARARLNQASGVLP